MYNFDRIDTVIYYSIMFGPAVAILVIPIAISLRKCLKLNWPRTISIASTWVIVTIASSGFICDQVYMPFSSTWFMPFIYPALVTSAIAYLAIWIYLHRNASSPQNTEE
jgi:hypothetical protein